MEHIYFKKQFILRHYYVIYSTCSLLQNSGAMSPSTWSSLHNKAPGKVTFLVKFNIFNWCNALTWRAKIALHFWCETQGNYIQRTLWLEWFKYVGLWFFQFKKRAITRNCGHKGPPCPLVSFLWEMGINFGSSNVFFKQVKKIWLDTITNYISSFPQKQKYLLTYWSNLT